ncbi:MAG: transglutaminase-like domain-containing protein [Eubacteriaceae bacterium]|nr:transglutaminase-like domain-containing protein [Eubacteriaceae bacterium]
MKKKNILIIFLIAVIMMLAGCSGSSPESEGPLRDSTPKVLIPKADGDAVFGDSVASIDGSNTDQGYVMVSFNDDCEKVIVRITGPDTVQYTYVLPDRKEYRTFPLSAGDGSYTVEIMQGVGGTSYVLAASATLDVSLENEFLPFLYPNQYSMITPESKAVKKAEELAEGAHSDLEVVTNIYHFVIENIEYDTEKAKSISAGQITAYIPDVDRALEEKKGICFDYASLMTAMLRSQGIPSKLEVGYAGESLHAWINTYIDEIGWVDKIIRFDGESWSLMDPTLGANNGKSSVGQYMGDGENYTLKYSY